MNPKITIDDLHNGKAILLEPCPGWPRRAVHYFDRAQSIAILAAREINRPLLVRGEPGCGKTQLARAAAQVLGMPLAWLVVNERTETEDLFWRYDALSRLSDANAGRNVSEEKEYLSAGPLWWALNHETAQAYAGRQSCKPYMGEGSKHPRDFENGVLLLIDEIDKADRSVPNSLLEALGNYSFDVPYIEDRVEWSDRQKAPFIVITTNGEQELPPAFLRRCLVLDMTLNESSEEAFVAQLSQRGRALLPDGFDNEDIHTVVAKLLWEKRDRAKRDGNEILPGQAEYIDHLEAILAIKSYMPGSTEDDMVKELASLTYDKHGN